MQAKTAADKQGIDISSLNTISDEALLFSKIDFMIVRAYGSDHRTTGDGQMASFVDAARRNGCPVGAYYFGTPLVDAAAGISTDAQIAANAETQAQQFIDKLYSVFGTGNVGDLVPIVDCETYVDKYSQYGHTATNNPSYPQAVMTSAQFVTWLKAFKSYFATQTGYKVGIYTGDYWLTTNDVDASGNKQGIGLTTTQISQINDDEMALWLAHYDEYNGGTTANVQPANLGNWTAWNAWQFTGIGDAAAYGIYHIDNYLDLNRCTDLANLIPVSIATGNPGAIFSGISQIIKAFTGTTSINKINKGDVNLFTKSPITTISPDVVKQDNIPFTVTLTTDEPGATIYYILGTGARQTYTGPFTVSQNSPNVGAASISIKYWSEGAAVESQKEIIYDTSGAIPGKPVVTVTNGTNQVKLDWAVTANTTSYSVFRSTISGDIGTALATFFSANTYTDTTGTPGTTYYYTVKANNYNTNTPSDQKVGVPAAPVAAGWSYIRITMYGDNNGFLFRTVEWEAWNVGATVNVLRNLQPFATTNAGFTPQTYTPTVCTDGSYDVNKRFAFMNNTNNTPATCTYKLDTPTALSDFRQWTYSISGDQRKMKFKVEVSKDNAAWTLVADYSTNTTIANNIDGKFPNAITFPAA